MLRDKLVERGKGVSGVPRGDAGESTPAAGGGAESSGPRGVAWRRNASGGGIAVRDDVDKVSFSGGAPAAVAPAGDADDATTAVASSSSTPRAAGSIDASKVHIFATSFYTKLSERHERPSDVSQTIA